MSHGSTYLLLIDTPPQTTPSRAPFPNSCATFKANPAVARNFANPVFNHPIRAIPTQTIGCIPPQLACVQMGRTGSFCRRTAQLSPLPSQLTATDALSVRQRGQRRMHGPPQKRHCPSWLIAVSTCDMLQQAGARVLALIRFYLCCF